MRATIGVLVLLTLVLLARDARRSDRERGLQERLAAVEAKLRLKRATPKPASAPADVVSDAPVATPSAAPDVEKPSPAPVSLTEKVARKMLWKRPGPDLTEGQNRAIEELRTSRDAQTQVYKDLIRAIEERTELAIRQLLDPDQLALYDGQRYPDLQVQMTYAVQHLAASAGAPSAYLGIAGDDAAGGGAKVSDVLNDTTASRSGLRAGDVILSFDGEAIPDYGALAGKIRAAGPGQAVNLRIRRADQEFDQSVPLGARP